LSDDLNVKVDATTGPYEAAIGRAQNATIRWDATLKQLESDMMKLQKQLDDDIAAALKRQHDAMTKVGRAAFVFGASMAAGLGMAANEAVKWETAWTGVTKTVNGSAAQMDFLETQLRGLATTLPATHEEIAAVAEAAGQLGIQRDSIVGFTKTMIDLSQTTNLTADQAATDMARFANIMQTPQDKIDRLGASLVALGNAGASTEADILGMAMRIAGAGKQVGFTEGEVMGLANALSSVGIEAEAGGSAISMVIKNIQLAVATGSPKLEQFAKVAGMSATEFKKVWDKSAAQGLDSFVTGLGRIKTSGGDTISVLNQMGITQIRQSDALLRLSGAGDLLTGSLQLGNQAWKDNTALLNEANQRYGTTASQVAVARNELRDAAITMGDTLLPAIAAVATFIGDMTRTWQDLPGPIHDVVLVLAIASAGIGIFGGAALIAIPKIAAFKAAVQGLEAGALKTAGTRLMGMGSLLAGPWGIAIAGGIAALGYFAAKHAEVMKSVDEVTHTLDAQTGAVTDNTRQWAIKTLQDQGALVASSVLGLNLKQVTDAALGNADALAAVTDQLARVPDDGLAAQLMIGKVSDSLGVTNDTLNAAKGAWQLQQQAMGGSTDATQKAGTAQEGTTQAWQDGADAAGDLTEEAKTLGEQMAELAQTYLDQRDADRAVRSGLRDIKAALKEYRKEHDGLKGAFREGSKSGDDFGAMLDDLAADYQKALEAAEKNGASQRELKKTYRESFDELVKQADALGMTTGEAKLYAQTVLGLPSDYTFAIHNNIEQTQQRISDIQTALNNLHGANLLIRLTTIHAQQNMDANGNPMANGGLVTAYAGGGIAADGGYVPRVSQIAKGRTIMWAEPSTGWEAYISGKPGMEARNRDIWAQAGRRLGVVPEALQSAAYSGSYGSGGGRGGGTTVIHQTLPGRFEFVLDDGSSFTGYVRGHATDVARSEIEADASYQDGLKGMRH
jgi:TP901 family phage tail tape measure protein